MKNCKWWFITIYSFDEDRPLYGPYSSEKECWNAMLENAKRELRIDTEENGWECEFETVLRKWLLCISRFL